jgi:hypothetical protein
MVVLVKVWQRNSIEPSNPSFSDAPKSERLVKLTNPSGILPTIQFTERSTICSSLSCVQLSGILPDTSLSLRERRLSDVSSETDSTIPPPKAHEVFFVHFESSAKVWPSIIRDCKSRAERSRDDLDDNACTFKIRNTSQDETHPPSHRLIDPRQSCSCRNQKQRTIIDASTASIGLILISI